MKRLLIISIALLSGASAVAVGTAAISGSPLPGGIFDAEQDGAMTRHEKVVDGGEWSLSTFVNATGATCAKHNVPGEGVGTLCIDPARMFEDERDVLVLPGARQLPDNGGGQWDNMWIYGFVRSNVASLELVNVDCSTVKVPLGKDRTFMHTLDRARIRSGVVPYEVVARDAAGEVTDEQQVNIGPPRNDGPKPAPGQGCR